MKQQHNTQKSHMESPQHNHSVHRIYIVVILLFLAVLATICFAPLLPQFFSQDDFGFIKIGMEQSVEKFTHYLMPTPGRFRPMGNVTYFIFLYKLFGLNPLPYHIVSLLFHLCNSLLIYLLLRKLRISQVPAIIASGFFALNVAHFHTIGWISCAKQLQASLFMLLSIYFAIGSLQAYSAKKQFLSALAYFISILNMEQAVLTPFVIFLVSFLSLTKRRFSLGNTIKTVWPHFLILGIYGLFILFWKGIPEEGVSRFEFGINIFHNIIVYLGATYDFWPIVTNTIPNLQFGLVPSHLILGAFVIYLIMGKSFRELAFGLAFLFLMLLPLLFLFGHFFYYHMYIPSFGILFLLGLVLEDLTILFKRLRLHTKQHQLVAASIILLVVAGFSCFKVRENVKLAVNEETRAQASFVMRRSIFAKNMFNDLDRKAGDLKHVKYVHMVYINPGLDKIGEKTELAIGGMENEIRWAFANGNVARVYFHKYDIEVSVDMDFEPRAPQGWHEGQSRVFFYDPLGNVYTYDELMNTFEKYITKFVGEKPGSTVKSNDESGDSN
jgi:hypothetical protein